MLRTQNANLYLQHTFLMLSVVGNSFCWEITRYQAKARVFSAGTIMK